MPSITFDGSTEYLKWICDTVLAADTPATTVADKPKPKGRKPPAPEPVAATPAEPEAPEPVAATPAKTETPEPAAVPTIEATRKALQDFMGRTSAEEAGNRLREFGYPNVTSIPECRRAEFISSLET